MTERRRTAILLGWALLIPLVYLGPAALSRFDPRAPLWAGGCTILALGAVLLHARTRILDRAGERFGGTAPLILGLAAAAYVAVSLSLAHHRLTTFSPHLSQLGLFVQSSWTTLHGHLFANSHETVDGSLASHFGIHFSPTLLLLVPLHALWPSPLSLMAAQAIALALSVVPLFLLLRPRAGSPGGAILALGLLGLPVLAHAGSNDFHDTTFLPVLLLTALWALENRRTRIFLAAAVTALGVREDVGLLFVPLGLVAGLRGLGWRRAGAIAAAGLAWYLAVTWLVVPGFHAPGLWMEARSFLGYHLGRWGRTPLEVAGAMLSHPVDLVREVLARDRLHYVYGLLQPTLLLPVLGSPAWIMGLPALAVNVLSEHQYMRQVLKYYSILPALFAYLATARTAARLAEGPRRPASGLAVASVVLLGLLPALLLHRLPAPRPAPPAGPAAAVLELIPPEAAVYAPVGLYPHLARREYVASWETVGERILEPGTRARYDWIVLWPDGDPPGEPRDARVAEVLAGESGHRRVDGFAPLIVYRR